MKITPEFIIAYVQNDLTTRQLENAVEVQAYLSPVADAMVVRLKSYILDRVVWHEVAQYEEDYVPAVGVWNQIKHRIPIGWFQRRVKKISRRNITEIHVHHNCPHMKSYSAADHLLWMQGENQ